MKKIRFLLALIFASVCSLTSWAANREAPTIPANSAPVSGQSYYLYNVDAKLFLHSYNKVSEYPLSVCVTMYADENYVFQDGSNSKYFHHNFVWVNYIDNSCYWTINACEEGYTIQCSSYDYVATQFLGTTAGSTTLKKDCTSEDRIHWLFIPVDEAGNRFVAELKLYNALCALDTYNLSESLTKHFEDIYSNRANYTPQLLTSTASEVRNTGGMSLGYEAPWWDDKYPILWSAPDGSFGQGPEYTWALPHSTTGFNGNTINYSSGEYFYTLLANESRTLSATVTVDELSTLVYSTNGASTVACNIQIYVDDKLVRTLTGPQKDTYKNSNIYARFFEVLQPGTHTIKWIASSTGRNNYVYIRNIGVVKSPLITVSLLEPGSLGTEVLYNTDHIKNVRRLKVSGKMNNDDWAKIKMMSGLLDLDLSEAEFTQIPEGQFRVTSSDTVMQFLHRLVLPEGVTQINDEAFFGSFIDTLALPSTLKNIGVSAFAYSHIQEIDMPDDCTEVYGYATGSNAREEYSVFRDMKWLNKLKCAKNWTVIPAYTFADCVFIRDVVLPEKLEEIGQYAFSSNRYMNINFPEGMKRIDAYAFYSCYYAKFGPFPEGLQTIGDEAFYSCDSLTNVVIPQSVTSIGKSAFRYCAGLKYAELGTRQYYISEYLFQNTPIKTLRLNSPTVVTLSESSYYPIESSKLKDVDLIVPSFLVNAYKLDKYWYNFKSITGFSTAEKQDWVINYPLVMNHDRFEGNPNITVGGNLDRKPYLKFNGSNAQDINNLTLEGAYDSSKRNYPGQIFSNGSNIRVDGNVQVHLRTDDRKWYFFSLPFDVKISDITHSVEGVQYKIGYYDGANRAVNGASGSWKSYDKENDVIPAGTGFIIQTNKNTWCFFNSVDNEMKQNLVSYEEFVKPLEVNTAAQKANTGWNLVGNPYQCFYNSHCLNFTAPITVWDTYNSKYVAYSITDDDYAIRPNEAFFVQCPNEEYNTIGFPLQGRQFTSVIENQNAVRAMEPTQNKRSLVNIILTAGDKRNDETRIVLNEKTSLEYEMTCDASKFQSMDNSVPQLFTLDNEGTQYAINERPMDNGIVKLGFSVAQAGTYSISIGRCDVGRVMLIDNKTGKTADLVFDTYSFSTDAGTFMNRFEIVFDKETVSGINTPVEEAKDGDTYNMAGQRIENINSRGVYIVNGKKVLK